MAVADPIRNGVWQDMRSAARLARYYEKLADRYRRKHQITRYLLLAATTIGTASLLGLFPEQASRPAQLSAGALTVAVIAWDFMSSYSNKSAVLHSICVDCVALGNEYKALWIAIDSGLIDDSGAAIETKKLSKRLLEATSRFTLADVSEDRKLNNECLDEADEVLEARHAS